MNKHPASWDELLPPELVSHVFTLALEGTEARSIRVDSSTLLLGRVSKCWRDIVYSTPALWASVYVSVTRAATIPRLVPGIQAWLLRAGTLPLSVRLEISCASQVIFPQIALLTSAVLSFSPQIRHLVIWINYISSSYPERPINTQDYIILSDSGFPILDTLEISCLFDRGRPNVVLAKMLASAPALREFSVMNYSGTTTVIPVPLARLQRLICGPCEPPHTAHNMLRRAPALEECRFWFALPFPSPTAGAPSADEVTTHRNLRRLYICSAGFEQFLSGLALPALTHLAFDGAGQNCPDVWPLPSATAFLARSRCALEELSFLKIKTTPWDLEACVEMAGPTLRVLCIDRGPDGLVGAALLKRLTAPPPGRGVGVGGVVCPRLEHVRVCGGVLEREGYGVGMLDMLESRFYRDSAGEDGVARLRSAVVGGTFGPWQRKRVEKLKKDGLDLDFILEGNRYS